MLWRKPVPRGISLKEVMKLVEPITGDEAVKAQAVLDAAHSHPEMVDDSDNQMDADREYFEKHPYATCYYRQPFEIEKFQALNLEGKRLLKVRVCVSDEHVGARFRQFIFATNT